MNVRFPTQFGANPFRIRPEREETRPPGTQVRSELEEHFGGWTRAPGMYEGAWKSAKTGQTVVDQSYRYEVAAPASQLDSVRLLLAEACAFFEQQVIYLAVAGRVEFIRRPIHDPP